MNPSTDQLNTFITDYIVAMLWSSLDDDGEPLDDNYCADDLSSEAMERVRTDCRAFLKDALPSIESAELRDCDFNKIAYAGHDFWLTRVGHGAGFWDGDWSEPAATYLTALASNFGDLHPYVVEDLIYLE